MATKNDKGMGNQIDPRQYSKPVVFEGQVNIEFIIEAFNKNNYSNYKIFLIDCDAEIMWKRLINKRLQPELANQNMLNWLSFLRKQAGKFNISIVDTGRLNIDSCCNIILKGLRN